MNRGYVFKLYPTKAQEAELFRQCSMVADLWNSLLHMQEERYRRTKGQRGVVHDPDLRAHLTRWDMSAMVKPLREQCPEWEAVSVYVAHRTIQAVDLAFASFFKRAKSGAGISSGYPKFKSFKRGDHDWLPHRFASGCKLNHVKGNSWELYLKGIEGMIHARGKLPHDPSKWTNADIRIRHGVWWLAVGIEVDDESPPAEGEQDLTIHLDGIECVAQVNGRRVFPWSLGIHDFESPKIEATQQRLSELTRGTDEYASTKIRLGRLHEKRAQRRKEKLHEWTTELVRTARSIRLIVPADIQTATKSGRGDEREWGAAVQLKAEFNRAVLFCAPATIANMIRYKANTAGVPLTEEKHSDLQVGNLAVASRKATRKVERAIKQERKKWGT